MTDHNKPFVSCRCRCCRVLRKVPNVLKSENCKTDAVNISLTRDVTSFGMAVPFSDCRYDKVRILLRRLAENHIYTVLTRLRGVKNRLRKSKLERNASKKLIINICFLFFYFTGFILAISCGIYPSGWGSVEFKQACGNDANFYKLGHCNLGWAFFVFVAGTGSAFICAALSTRAGKQKKMSYSRTSIERSNSFLM